MKASWDGKGRRRKARSNSGASGEELGDRTWRVLLMMLMMILGM